MEQFTRQVARLIFTGLLQPARSSLAWGEPNYSPGDPTHDTLRCVPFPTTELVSVAFDREEPRYDPPWVRIAGSCAA